MSMFIWPNTRDDGDKHQVGGDSGNRERRHDKQVVNVVQLMVVRQAGHFEVEI